MITSLFERATCLRLARLLILGVLAISSASCVVNRDGDEIDGPQVVMRFERDGGFVDGDTELAAALAGDLRIGDATARAAYCVNGTDWEEDVALDTVIVVATSPRLVRAAELVADGEFERELGEAVESELLAAGGGSDSTVEELSPAVRDRWGDAELEAYLTATAEPPSEEASVRFVVYAASKTTSAQFVTFIDLERVDRNAIERLAGRPFLGDDDILFAGDQPPVVMNVRDCDELNWP
jgi:hypothetical protein